MYVVYELKINLEDGGSQAPTVMGGYRQGKKERTVELETPDKLYLTECRYK